jgi:Fe-S cluster assembly protein SufB
MAAVQCASSRQKKNEPEWMLEWRLDAYRALADDGRADLGARELSEDRLQDIYYYAAPKSTPARSRSTRSIRSCWPSTKSSASRCASRRSWPACRTRRGRRRCRVRFRLVVTTFKEELAKAGVIFMPISEAIREHPELVKKYLGTVVPTSDNYYATLNSPSSPTARSSMSRRACAARWSCRPISASTSGHRPVRAHADHRRQGRLRLLSRRLHRAAARREPAACGGRRAVALDDAEIKYSTVQNWYPGDAEGKGGIYNFVTKRGDCRGKNSKISWTQVETGSAITWKYPSCILRGDNSRGEFYSIAISNGHQQVDSGTKMIHLGKNTTSRIISKGIAAGKSQNTYRGLVSAHRKATNARNFTQCDSLLIGDKCGAHTVPYIEAKNATRAVRARGDDLEDLRRPAVLLPAARPVQEEAVGADRQRLRQGSAAAAADGIRGRSAEADPS